MTKVVTKMLQLQQANGCTFLSTMKSQVIHQATLTVASLNSKIGSYPLKIIQTSCRKYIFHFNPQRFFTMFSPKTLQTAISCTVSTKF